MAVYSDRSSIARRPKCAGSTTLLATPVILGNIGEKIDKDYHGMPGFKAVCRSAGHACFLLPSPHRVLGVCMALSAALLFPQNKDVFLVVKLSWRRGWAKEGIALFT